MAAAAQRAVVDCVVQLDRLITISSLLKAVQSARATNDLERSRDVVLARSQYLSPCDTIDADLAVAVGASVFILPSPGHAATTAAVIRLDDLLAGLN
jgi:hypothetical protein